MCVVCNLRGSHNRLVQVCESKRSTKKEKKKNERFGIQWWFSLLFASITGKRSCDYCVCSTGGTKRVVCVCVEAECTVRWPDVFFLYVSKWIHFPTPASLSFFFYFPVFLRFTHFQRRSHITRASIQKHNRANTFFFRVENAIFRRRYLFNSILMQLSCTLCLEVWSSHWGETSKI